MIDKDIHTALFELEKNLQDLSSAKQQINEIKEISSGVILAISNLQDKYSSHLINIEETHQKNLESYKNTLSNFTTKLEDEYNKIVIISKNSIKSGKESIKILQNGYSNQITDLEIHHKKTINDYKETLQTFIIRLSTEQDKIISTSKDIINNAKNEFRQFINYQKDEINKYHISLISSTKNVINDTIEQLNKSTEKHNLIFNNQDETIKQHLTSYQIFLDKVGNLLKYIEQVNFPSRLDKIDNSISSINIGIQNLQGNINDLQREQQKKFDHIEKLITDKFAILDNQNSKLKKRNQIYLIILIALIIISSIMIKFA